QSLDHLKQAAEFVAPAGTGAAPAAGAAAPAATTTAPPASMPATPASPIFNTPKPEPKKIPEAAYASLKDLVQWKMTEIYEKHNPEKLSKIPDLLKKYEADPMKIYAKLCDTYKVPVEDLRRELDDWQKLNSGFQLVSSTTTTGGGGVASGPVAATGGTAAPSGGGSLFGDVSNKTTSG
ncbi:unnamed protein product, partial [Amoebophrya sp. A120]